jgi:hypothetical protein
MSSQAAAELARKRWKGTTPEERSEAMGDVARSRWDSMSDEDRKAHGAMLAAARAKNRSKKAAKPKKRGKN